MNAGSTEGLGGATKKVVGVRGGHLHLELQTLLAAPDLLCRAQAIVARAVAGDGCAREPEGGVPRQQPVYDQLSDLRWRRQHHQYFATCIVDHAETSVPEENVVNLQFDPAKLSQSVVLSERLERDDDGTQLLLFPELADEVPLADPKITSIQPNPVPGIALGTDLPPQDPDLTSFPPTASLMTRVLQMPADTRRAALRSSPEVVAKLRALQAKMSV